MKKLVSFFICTLLFSTNTFAQNNIIFGVVKDSISGAGVAYAQVAISEEASNKYVSMGITAENGAYKIDGLPEGSFNMKISILGYKTKIIEGIKFTTEQKKIKLDVLLNLDAQVLNEAVVVGDRTSIEFRPDKKIIHIDPANAVGASVAEFLKSIPEIKVDEASGTVTLKTYSPTILVNGKPASKAMEDLTKIPAGLISSIEIITNPSVRYNPEGLGGIINLKTRRLIEGLNGMIQGSAGSNNNYNSAGTLNYKTKKWNPFINFYDNFSGSKISGNSNQQYNSGYSVYQTLTSLPEVNRITARVGTDYEPDSMNVFTLFWEFSSRTATVESNNNYDETGALNNRKYSSNQTENTTSTDNQIGFNYVHTFRNTGELNMDITQFFSHEPNHTNLLFKDTVTYNYNNEKLNDARETSIYLNYSSPLFEKWKMEVGASIDIEHYEVQDSLSGKINEAYNHLFGMNKLTNAYYLSLGKSFNKLSSTIGLRGEYTNWKLSSPNFQPIYHDYFNIFPNLGLNYQINDNFNMYLSYGRRIKRPNIFALSPYATIDARYPTERYIGNPDLKPAYTNSIDFGGYRRWAKLSVSSSASYMRTNNDIADVYYTKDGIIFNTRKNVATVQKYLFYANMDYYSILWKIYRPILTLSFGRELYDTPDASGNNIHKSFFNYNFNLNNVFYLPGNWYAFFVATYYPPTHQYASTTEANTDLKLTVRKTFKNNLTLMIAFYNILNSQTVIRTFGDGFTSKKSLNNNTQSIYLGIMYKFGKPIQTRAKVNLNIDRIETQ